MSLVRLWLSLESLSGQGWAHNREIYRRLSGAGFRSFRHRAVHRLMNTAALGATLFAGAPGFRRAGAWARDRLRSLRPGSRAR